MQAWQQHNFPTLSEWLRGDRYPSPSQPRIADLRTVRVSITLGVFSLTESEQLTWLKEMRYLSVRACVGPTAARNHVPPLSCEVYHAVWEETSKCTM